MLYTPGEEHFGIVPCEAMEKGIPVIAINNGGPRETVGHKETGFLVPKNAKKWSEYMLLLVTILFLNLYCRLGIQR